MIQSTISIKEVNMSIKIGNNNIINNSSIYENSSTSQNKKTFSERHPIFIGLMCSFVIGLLLMFSFWEEIVSFLERRF